MENTWNDSNNQTTYTFFTISLVRTLHVHETFSHAVLRKELLFKIAINKQQNAGAPEAVARQL